MTPKIVLLDQDGPLANFEAGFLEAWRKRFPTKSYIPLKERRTHCHKDQYPPDLAEQVLEIYRTPGFFRNLRPTPGGIAAARELLAMGHDLRICTSPLSHFEHCVLEKYEWVEMHLGRRFTDRMILTKDKTVVAGNMLIDDNPTIIGAMFPSWHHIVFDMPFNRRMSPGTPRLTWTSWKKVLSKYLDE